MIMKVKAALNAHMKLVKEMREKEVEIMRETYDLVKTYPEISQIRRLRTEEYINSLPSNIPSKNRSDNIHRGEEQVVEQLDSNVNDHCISTNLNPNAGHSYQADVYPVTIL
jgi:hypothetical protein